MKSINKPSGRIYFFDWLRIIGFIIVILIHCFHMFSDLYQTRQGITVGFGEHTYAITLLAQWCMALFFLLAGASTWMALRRKTARQFVQERFQRLLLPLVIGFVTLVPLQTYYAMVSNEQYSGTLIEFYSFFAQNILFNGNWHWIIIHSHHLWFIAYLFVFSLLTLPLCLYLRSTRGQLWIERLAIICERPGGMFLLITPIVIARVALQAAFPIYCSLADAVCWLLYYICGYMLLANPRLRQALQQQWRGTLGVWLVGSAGMLLAWQTGWFSTWIATPDYSVACLLFQALTGFTLWSWLAMTMVAGEKCLNRNCSFLKYGSAASFWWYLVHFPVVVIVAYIVLPLQINPIVSFMIIVVGASLATYILSDVWMRLQASSTQLKAGWQIVVQQFSHNEQIQAIHVEHQRTKTGRLITQTLVG